VCVFAFTFCYSASQRVGCYSAVVEWSVVCGLWQVVFKWSVFACAVSGQCQWSVTVGVDVGIVILSVLGCCSY
jgi:hypothetical protein